MRLLTFYSWTMLLCWHQKLECAVFFLNSTNIRNPNFYLTALIWIHSPDTLTWWRPHLQLLPLCCVCVIDRALVSWSRCCERIQGSEAQRQPLSSRPGSLTVPSGTHAYGSTFKHRADGVKGQYCWRNTWLRKLDVCVRVNFECHLWSSKAISSSTLNSLLIVPSISAAKES